MLFRSLVEEIIEDEEVVDEEEILEEEFFEDEEVVDEQELLEEEFFEDEPESFFNFSITEELDSMLMIAPQGNPNQYSIKTTDEDGKNVNGNNYESKKDVFVRIDGEADVSIYWIFVVSPNGTNLGSGGPFEAGRVFNLYDLVPFADTDNPGGSYNVWVGIEPTFDHSSMKNDHFKVKDLLPQIGRAHV